MEVQMKKTRERLEEEFNQISSMEKWTKESLETMKNILKSIYYIDVICAMQDGNGEEYSGMSYARGGRRGNSAGSYSYNGPYYSRPSMSGKRYYDDERNHAIDKLHRMMESAGNEEVRMAIQNALGELE
jgi:hypothetical protein